MFGIALLGAGIFATEQHLPAIEASSLLELKAVYSRSEKSAAALARRASKSKRVDVYHDDGTHSAGLDELLARTDISMIIACVTILAQPDVIRKALAAGKHVLSEKPVAPDVATARELLGSYHSSAFSQPSSRPIWAVGENFRFNKSVRYAESRIEEMGGQLVTFRLNYHTWLTRENKYFNTDWRKVPAFQGGFLLDTGVHFIATLRLLLAGVGQEIKQVAAYSTLLEEHLVPVDTIHAIASTTEARHGTICLSFGTEFKSGLEIEIVTTHGAIHWTPVRVTTTKKSNFSSELGKSPQVISEARDFVYNNAVGTELEAFAASIAAGVVDPRQTPVEALKDLTILQALLDSGESGGCVKICS